MASIFSLQGALSGTGSSALVSFNPNTHPKTPHIRPTDDMARRLTKELSEFEKNSPDWCTVGSVDDDLMHWNAMVAGPEGSPYSGGVFSLDLQFPTEYPFKAPKIKFLTKVYHPNVKTSSGEICADIINENWAPTLNVLFCLTAIKQILAQPNVDNPLEPEIARQFQTNKETFDQTAQEWTKQYAT